MTLPSSVSGELELGGILAAEVRQPKPDWRAWVWVRPKMKCGQTYSAFVDHCRRNQTDGWYDHTIESYRVRYIELSEWHLSEEWYFDMDLAMDERPVVDASFEVNTESELEILLARWMDDLSILHSPWIVKWPEPPNARSEKCFLFIA